MPVLKPVLDPCELGKHLNGVLPSDWGVVRVIEIQVLLHHPRRRCTLNVALQMATGRRELIAKVYASDRSDVYYAMEEISRPGFGPEDEFSIPKPLAFIPELHLLLLEKVGGQGVGFRHRGIQEDVCGRERF
jgi:hypothetical protein